MVSDPTPRVDHKNLSFGQRNEKLSSTLGCLKINQLCLITAIDS